MPSPPSSSSTSIEYSRSSLGVARISHLQKRQRLVEAVVVVKRVADAAQILGEQHPLDSPKRIEEGAVDAHKEGTTLREAALASGDVTEEQFDAWVVPADMTGPRTQA